MHPPPRPPTTWLTGFIADLPTPFDDRDELDLLAFEHLCERQIDAGATAILVGETAGEFATLSLDDRDALLHTAVATARGRSRVIAGAGSNSTCRAVELTRQAEAAGVDAVMSVVPYYNKPTQPGLEAHFRAIADATRLPIVLHDCPMRTGRALADESLCRLAISDQFIGLNDATSDIPRQQRLRRTLRPDFRLLTGSDETAMAFLMQGGDGCVSSIANIYPDLCGELYGASRLGQSCYAAGIADLLAPLIAAFARDTTPASLKFALNTCGLIPAGLRLPMLELDDPQKRAIDVAMANLETKRITSR